MSRPLNQGECIEATARGAYEVYRAYSNAQGDHLFHWEDAPASDRAKVLEYVHRVLDDEKDVHHTDPLGHYAFDGTAHAGTVLVAGVVRAMAVALGIRAMRAPRWDGIEETDTRKGTA